MEIADGLLTNTLIKKGIAQEGNPLLMNIAGGSGLIIIKIVGVLLAIFILWDINRHHPKLAFWTASAFLLIYVAIVAWNARILITG